jgi:hypothetical protein
MEAVLTTGFAHHKIRIVTGAPCWSRNAGHEPNLKEPEIVDAFPALTSFAMQI